jgi:hypothetical protein
MSRMRPLVAGLATTAFVSVGLVLGAANSQADPAFGPSYGGGNCPPGIGTCTHWCPGDPAIPGSQVITWDWNVCHDWYWNSEGTVDIATNIVYPWHGVPHEAPPPPPPPAGPPPPLPPRPADCPPFNIPFFGPSRCGGL